MSYEEEKKAIWDWYKAESREYLEAPYIKGRPYAHAELNLQHRKNTAEFNRRLDALEVSYNGKRHRMEWEGERISGK